MQNKKLSIRKIVSYLNDHEAEGGGFWLPNIQRPFVWSEDQIARLFDSIMREYPISTLLAWKTREEVKHRRFIDLYHLDIKLTDYQQPDNSHPKMMVLDGQQRLQSLFIGLRGSYCGKELHFDILSGAQVAPEDIRYRFAFKDKSQAMWPWVRFKDIIASNVPLIRQIASGLILRSNKELTPDEKDLVEINVERARQEFVNGENITFQELDGIDNPDAYKIDDIVEIFIRANSGGTKLGKSDLLFSLLTSSWDAADREMEVLLESLNQGGFAFDRDFVLKSCLTILGRGARYEVAKFRDGRTKEEIVNQWEQISNSIKAVRDYLISNTFIRSDKAIPSYLALIPLIYCRFHYPESFRSNPGIQKYLLQALATSVFGGSPDNLIDKIVRCIEEQRGFNCSEVFGVIQADGRSLEITPNVIYEEGYGSKAIHLFFNLWYGDIDYSPALNSNGPQVDHIFPQSLLKNVKDINPESGKRNLLRHRQESRDQIANCMLLTAEENGAGGKSDTPPDKWFDRSRFKTDDEHQRYLERHLIPRDTELWKLERFEDFIRERKLLIKGKFAFMVRKDREGEVQA